ncbi:MAG: leucine-rich repeat protein [Clostridiales bacterium]|nr:leucine-rich repeat protein [Candidatus Equinaster intestinalis]
MNNYNDFEIENGYVTKYSGKGGDIVIPEGVTGIEELVFYGIEKGIKSITVPKTVTHINSMVFKGACEPFELKVDSENPVFCSEDGVLFSKDKTMLICCPASKAGEYTVPECVKTLGFTAFWNCIQLTRIVLPAGLESIGEETFDGCDSLERVDVAIENPFFSSVDGVLFNKDKTRLLLHPAARMEAYVIPQGVKEIACCAFISSTALKRVIIPESVTEIGYCAFALCSNLLSVTIPASVTKIGEDVFNMCYDVMICTTAGSCAEKYARENGIPFSIC